MSHACHHFWKCYKTLTFCSLLTRSTIPCACHVKRHLNAQKCSESIVFLTFLLFKMCFAPQRRALFRHRNFQKWSEHVVFLAFWLRNVFRATTACTFSTSQLPKVLRAWCALYILTWKCASRHNGVHFFDISTSKSGPNMVFRTWLRTGRFSKPTFRPSGATNHWKNIVFRDFPTFPHTWIFFLLRLSLFVIFLLLLFSDSSHLCFSSVHIVGSLTSKLPSAKGYQTNFWSFGISFQFYMCADETFSTSRNQAWQTSCTTIDASSPGQVLCNFCTKLHQVAWNAIRHMYFFLQLANHRRTSKL